MSARSSRKADGPLSLVPTPQSQPNSKQDQCTDDASQMALVHNVLIRAFNSIHIQATKVRAEDVVDFLGYCIAWHKMLQGHHDGEEEVFFPGIEKATGVKGIMDSQVDEHAAFSEGLKKFKDYIDACLADPSQYAGHELVKIMDTFGEVLAVHLASEPPKIATLSQYDFDLKPISDQTASHSLKFMHLTDVLPVLWFNRDVEFEGGRWTNFPNMPSPVKWVLINAAGSWQKRWWRFASSGADGVQRELLCLTEAYAAK
ncbi:unnamed protein product [Discula destructiva]